MKCNPFHEFHTEVSPLNLKKAKAEGKVEASSCGKKLINKTEKQKKCTENNNGLT